MFAWIHMGARANVSKTSIMVTNPVGIAKTRKKAPSPTQLLLDLSTRITSFPFSSFRVQGCCPSWHLFWSLGPNLLLVLPPLPVLQ
jgi:hypothetical protein